MGMSMRKYNRPSAWFAALGLAALATSLAACLEEPEYPDTPFLRFEGLSRDTMVQGALLQDSTTVVLYFEDGDGDISFPDGDTTRSVFLTNVRTNERLASFNIDPIEENGLENGISGEFQLRVYTTCCDYPPFVAAFPCEVSDEYPIDTLLLEAHLIDRAGNESNRVPIAPIYLQCDRR